MKTIGILGGMGPTASSKFLDMVVKYCQLNYGAIQDYEFPKMVLYSVPLNGFNETGVEDEKLVIEQLKESIIELSKNVDFIVIPCNTVHCYINILKKVSKVPILSIIELVKEEIENKNYKKTLLLCSQTTYEKKMYENYIEPNEKKEVENLILEVMKGKVISLNKVLKIIESYNEIDSVLLGCTELPLVINSNNCNINIVDSLDILAKKTVDYSYSS